MTPLPVRLHPGDDLRAALEALHARHGGAFVLCGIGSLQGARLRLAAQAHETVFDGAFEILTLCGSLSADGAHLHMAVADAAGRVIGGHVGYGNVVRTTAEVLLAGVGGWALQRAPDAATGFDELVVRRAAAPQPP